MPTEIRNISLVADNSVFPPEVSLSNEVITRVFPRNPVPKCIRHKCKIMKNICGYILCGCCCNSNFLVDTIVEKIVAIEVVDAILTNAFVVR